MCLRPELCGASASVPSSQALAIDGAPEPCITMDDGLRAKSAFTAAVHVEAAAFGFPGLKAHGIRLMP